MTNLFCKFCQKEYKNALAHRKHEIFCKCVNDARNDNDLCVICYDKLNKENEQTYSIPECSHTFHTTCINSWFRQGNQKCPLCNDIGIAGENNARRRYIWL